MEILKKIKLLRGDVIEILVCRGINISRAVLKYNDYIAKNPDNKLDLTPFLFSELCLVNSEKKEYNYFIDLLSDDYCLILENITPLLESIIK